MSNSRITKNELIQLLSQANSTIQELRGQLAEANRTIDAMKIQAAVPRTKPVEQTRVRIVPTRTPTGDVAIRAEAMRRAREQAMATGRTVLFTVGA